VRKSGARARRQLLPQLANKTIASASASALTTPNLTRICTTRADTTGHERSLTQIVFNAEGDLLFSASKDKIVNAWYTSNGERLGTYNGHNGSVWTVDCDCA
jgi:translation initiation factor 3 subunit I